MAKNRTCKAPLEAFISNNQACLGADILHMCMARPQIFLLQVTNLPYA